MQCRSHAAQLGRLYPEFKAAHCEILLVLGAPLAKAQSYAEILRLPFPVLSDPDRHIYHLYGLERALIVIQRTASLVVDRDGIIRYIKAATNPMLWLQESRELLVFVKSMSFNE
jgi:peroxiredoxin